MLFLSNRSVKELRLHVNHSAGPASQPLRLGRFCQQAVKFAPLACDWPTLLSVARIWRCIRGQYAVRRSALAVAHGPGKRDVQQK